MCKEESIPSLLDKYDNIVSLIKDNIGYLSETDLKQLNILIEKLRKVNSTKNVKTKEKGDALEDVVDFLLEKIGLFSVYKNVKTSTNEIDQFIKLNEKGIAFSQRKLIPIPNDGFLGECKNYNKKVQATWIGKFFSLLTVSNVKFGILFSFYGLTGKNWNDATGLTKKIYMLREKKEDKTITALYNF